MSRNSNQFYDTIHDDQQEPNIHGLMCIIRQKKTCNMVNRNRFKQKRNDKEDEKSMENGVLIWKCYNEAETVTWPLLLLCLSSSPTLLFVMSLF